MTDESKNRKPEESSRLITAGMFLVTLATLVYELLLTRIFSVTMWYHCAFMAVSVAVFGMTVGAIAVYLTPALFKPERTAATLSVSTLLFALSSVASFWLHLCLLNSGQFDFNTALQLTYIVISVPFLFSGITVCLVLTRYSDRVSQYYAADLLGAAAGCMVLPLLLELLDGPTAVIAVGVLAGLAACAFSGNYRRLLPLAIVATALLVLAVPFNKKAHFLRLDIIKGQHETKPLFEKWSMSARIRVFGDGEKQQPARNGGWAISDAVPADVTVKQLNLDIDSFAETFLTAFNGDFSQVRHLRYDVTNFVHYLRSGGSQLVVGVGGGRDILSGLLFGQKSIRGIELNKDIVRALEQNFSHYSGEIARDPRVKLVNDEARSYITRNKERYDIIQISMIDTFAASSAGAFVLSENSLYTVEAFKTFLSRLNPHGVLSCSRWYFRSRPGEIYRLVALAQEALRDIGQDPRKNLILVANFPASGGEGVGTLLVSPDPFSEEDIKKAEEAAKQLRFQVVLSPSSCTDQVIGDLVSSEAKAKSTIDSLPINIAPPTDDSPFFFQFVRLKDFLKAAQTNLGHTTTATNFSVFTLGTLFVTVVLLTVACIFVPLLLSIRQVDLVKTWPYLIYFCAIGFAYILIEISQIQRLTIFLGNPTLGLCVVLFTLLLSSGIGSYLSGKLQSKEQTKHLVKALAILCATVLVVGLATAFVVHALVSLSTPLKIAVTSLLLFPAGAMMGTAFPIAMKCASAEHENITPWLWGLNGATSACSSVMAIVIALVAGISAAYWSGLGFYLIALVCALAF